jgi:hypothetical protein
MSPKPSFDLETNKLDTSTTPAIPDMSKSQDQPISDNELETEWNYLLATMKDFVQEKVYTPLKEYYESKIKSKQYSTISEEYTNVIACVKQLEVDMRTWIEREKQLFMSSVRGHTKSVFYDEKELLLKRFKETWMLQMSKCTEKTIHSMKNMIKTIQRDIKPPMDISEERMRLMTIMNIRPDPETCGEDQKLVFDESIQTLVDRLQNGADFKTIEKELEPPPSIDPYINRMWTCTLDTYKKMNVEIEQSLNTMYNQLKSTWNDELFYDTLFMMDYKHQLNMLETAFAFSHNQNLIDKGQFRSKFASCYGAHTITCETYVTKQFPKQAQEWMNNDLKLMKAYIDRLRQTLIQLYQRYKSKFGDSFKANIDHFLTWISQEMVELRKNETIDSSLRLFESR